MRNNNHIHICFVLILSVCCTNLKSQNVGVGTVTPDPTAILDVVANGKGLLIPRMSSVQRTAIASPANGLLVYDLDSSSLFIYESIAWKRIKAISNLQNLIAGTAAGDVLVWNGLQWVVTPKCSLFTYFYRDKDGDGYGDKYQPVAGCVALPGFVSDSTDCNDNNATIYPTATDICNGIDDDCDGLVDEGCLTVTRSGAGSGTVTSTPSGINCGIDCSETYAPATVVTLTAAPTVGSVFSGWSGGGCSGTGSCVVTMNAATTVNAQFDPAMYTLTTNIGGVGTGTVTSSPAGINCGVDCSENYVAGTFVTLTAIAAPGSYFIGWSGGCSGTGICNVTMNSSQTVTAIFGLLQYNLTATKSGTGIGTVTSSPAGINCGVDCSELYNYGTLVTLTAVASSGSTFAGWSGGGCTGTGTCNVTMTAATTVTAVFTLNAYTLTVAKTGTGSGTVTSSPAGINCGVDCSEVYNHGTVVSLTATPAGGSSFIGWSGGGCSGTGACNVTLTSATTVTATFNSPSPEPSPGAATMQGQSAFILPADTATDFLWKNILNPPVYHGSEEQLPMAVFMQKRR